jgi:hypothetical protein
MDKHGFGATPGKRVDFSSPQVLTDAASVLHKARHFMNAPIVSNSTLPQRLDQFLKQIDSEASESGSLKLNGLNLIKPADSPSQFTLVNDLIHFVFKPERI